MYNRVHAPNYQKGKYAGEDGTRREWRARHYADSPHPRPEPERRCIGKRAPVRRRQGGRRNGPHGARHVAGDERAIGRTIAARIPPGDKILVAAELSHVDGPWPAPMILEKNIH